MRPQGDEHEVKAAKRPSLNMTEESKHSVWLYPHGNDKSAKRIVDCANKTLHGEPKEDSVHLWKREALQKYSAGLEFSKTPNRSLQDHSKSVKHRR